MTDIITEDKAQQEPEANKAKLSFATLRNIHRRNRELVQDRFLNRGKNPISQDNRGLVSDLSKDTTVKELEGDQDSLTGLLNKNGFWKRYEETVSLAKRSGMEVWVGVFDADGLKQKNDTEGHKAGDAYLINIAQTLSEGSRQGDYFARTGGDEFVGVFINPGKKGIENWWDRKAELITQNGVKLSGGAIKVKLSDMKRAIDDADQAMYKSKDLKKDGKSHFTLASYTPEGIKYKKLKTAA